LSENGIHPRNSNVSRATIIIINYGIWGCRIDELGGEEIARPGVEVGKKLS
jgi:hypothetical protein